MTSSLQKKMRVVTAFFFVLLAVNFMAAQKVREGSQELAPAGEGHRVVPASKPTVDTVTTGNGISYHGGPVMKGNPVNAYIIWYGNWSGSGSNTGATRSLIEHFLGTIGGSNIEKVNTTYGDNSGNVSGNVAFGGSTIVSSSTNLSD